MSRDELIQELIRDYREFAPEWTYADTLEIKMRLSGFDTDDLILLVSQIEKETPNEQQQSV